MKYMRGHKQWKATMDSAEFYLSKKGNVLMIDFAWCWQRGNGHATNIMLKIMEWAKKRKLKVHSTHPINPKWHHLCRRFGLVTHYTSSTNRQRRAFYAATLIHRSSHKRYNRVAAAQFHEEESIDFTNWTKTLAMLKKIMVENAPKSYRMTPKNSDLVIQVFEPMTAYV